VRSVLYRFPDLGELERLLGLTGEEAECEIGLPAGEAVEDGEWVLAIFELGPARRATSAAGRGTLSPEGPRLAFEPRDSRRLLRFTHTEAAALAERSPPSIPRGDEADEPAPDTARSPGAMEAEATSPPPGARLARVLLVDDDPDIRDLVAAMLEVVGLETDAVASAEEALARARREAFDLLVLDWNLPKMTGLELCRAIRKDEMLARLPVLFLTANASSQDMVDAFASGGDDYVVKPFRAPELGARIFSLLRRARLPPS